VSTRSEAFVSDNHARDMILNGELALDKKGRFLALNVEVLANMGAFLSATGPLTATVNIALCLPSVYNIPLIANTSHCVFTNSVPTGAYRGAGRPEANFLIERLIDAAALLTRIDKVELRRRNFLSPDMLPYRTPLGMTFDGGEFSEVLNKALELSDYGTFLTRRKLANKCGKMRGIGIGVFLEQTGGSLQEGSAVAFAEAGKITLQLGSQASGQGHKTVFRDMLAQRLGISRDCIVVKLGDTNAKVVGMGAVGSRSAVMVSGAMAKTVDSMLEKGRKVASLMLEADDADIVFANGTFSAVGTDLSVSLFDVAAKAVELKTLGQLGETLDTNLTTETPPTFPNGCHIAEVEIDPETGELELVAYTAVQDIGRVLNPVIAAGQVRGGVAQGVGQVLKEAVSYEAGSGQLQSASFMDYGIPRASNVPDAFKVAFVEVPSTTNPYGVKGVAESGTTGSLGALMNAIVDALPEDVGTALTMPVTPSELWTLLNRERTCPELLG
jgi:carbon-monoxide dehydrogenase large subunit